MYIIYSPDHTIGAFSYDIDDRVVRADTELWEQEG
jgi:hypothetical protein